METMMEVAVVWMFVWFVMFPKSLGRNIRKVIDGVRIDE